MGLASFSQVSLETRMIGVAPRSPRRGNEAPRGAQILPGDRVRRNRAHHQLGETTFESVREIASAARMSNGVGKDAGTQLI